MAGCGVLLTHALFRKYWCYGGYTGWVVLDMASLSMNIFPALNPRFLCNGMAVDRATRSIICTSLGQSASWFAHAPAHDSERYKKNTPCNCMTRGLYAIRFQLVSLPLSQLGNTSASPSVIIDNLASVCGFGANEQARDLEYDSDSFMVYISTQQ